MAEGHPYYPLSNNQTEPENQLPENPATRDDTGGSDSYSGAPRNGKGSYQPLLQPPPHVGVARPEQQQNNFAYGPPSVLPQPALALRPHPQMNPPYGPSAQQQNNYPPPAYPPFAYGPPPQIQQNNPPYGWAPHQIQPNNPHYHYGPPPPPPPQNYGSVMEAYGPINHMAPISGPRIREANKPIIAAEFKTNIRTSLFVCIVSILLCILPAIPFSICAVAFATSSVKLLKKNEPQLKELAIKRGCYALYCSLTALACAGLVWVPVICASVVVPICTPQC